MIQIEKTFLDSYNPYTILKNKELLDSLFNHIYTYNKDVAQKGLMSRGKNIITDGILSWALDYSNFIGGALSSFNEFGWHLKERELIRYLLLYSKEKKENIYKSAALIVLFVGASAHSVASWKFNTRALPQTVKGILRGLIKWNYSEFLLSMMKDQGEIEKQILIRINQSLFAFSMNLYFSDIKCSIDIVYNIINNLTFDTFENLVIPTYLSELLDYSFGNNLGILTGNKVRDIYSNTNILKQYIDTYRYKEECIDFFMKLIDGNKDLLTKGEFSRDEE